MDTLVQDVSCVMEALDSHGAKDLVNANLVFERLETLTADGQTEDLVNCVVRSFLIDLGMAQPEDVDDVIIIGEHEKKMDRVGIVRQMDDSPEVCVLSPGLAQAFEEPYSPLPMDLTPMTVDIKEDILGSINASVSVASNSSTSCVTNTEQPGLSSEGQVANAPKSCGMDIPSSACVATSSSCVSGECSSSNASGGPISPSASVGPSTLVNGGSNSSSHGFENEGHSSSSTSGGSNTSSNVDVNREHNLFNGSEGHSFSRTNEETSVSTEPKPSSDLTDGVPFTSKIIVGTKSKVADNGSMSSTTTSEVVSHSLGAIPKRVAPKNEHKDENLFRFPNESKSEEMSKSTNGALSAQPTFEPSVSSPSKRALVLDVPSELASEKKRLKTSPQKELHFEQEYFNSLLNVPDVKLDTVSANIVAAESRIDHDNWDIEPQNFVFHGAGSKLKSSAAAQYVANLSDMFPQADPQYLWDQCEQISDDEAFSALIVSMLTGNYPRFQDSKEVKKSVSSAAGSERDLKQENVSFTAFELPSSTVSKDSAPTTSVSSSATSVVASASVNMAASTSKAGSSHVTHIASADDKEDLGAVAKVPEKPEELWQEKFEFLLQILPDADPSFLEEKAREHAENEDQLRQFVADALEHKNFPSRKDWLWRKEQMALQKKYTEEFSITNFLEVIPDPFTYFTDVKRQCSNKNQANMFLRNKYRKVKIADIVSTYSNNKYNLTLTCRALERWTGATMKSRRNPVDYDITKNDIGKGIDVPFLQEIAFIENEHRIVDYLENKKVRRDEAFAAAKAKGELLQCQCCYDDEVLMEDVRTCPEGHIFCVSCLQKSSEQRIGDGHTTFPCLADCSAEFTLQTLQEILKPTIFSRLVQRKQVEEVKAAGIEDLVQCPFCDFCNIPPREDKVFRCLNPDCMKESCRLCKEVSHVPLRCDEVEKKTDVEMRTYIENKMTEALVRTCWRCQKKFVKEDGCNKMTCQCGALMCYICRQPVKDYNHFNGQGGDKYERCPLYSDHHALEAEEVRKGAEQAKQEVLSKKPNTVLKHDPTKLLPVYEPSPQPYYDNYSDNSDYDDLEEEDDYFYRNRRYGYDDDEFDEEEEEENEEEQEGEVEDEDSEVEECDSDVDNKGGEVGGING